MMTAPSSLIRESPIADDRPASHSHAADDRGLRLYEQRIATLVSSARAIAFANARTALAAVFRAAGLVPGDEVMLSPLTCKVVPLTLISLQLRPVFADISDTTLNLDAARLPATVGPRTRAVLFQHTYGSPAGADAVAEWAAARDLLLVEHRAQCVPLAGAGTLPRRGRAAVFSNNLLKPLPAGSGGVAVTDDAGFAERIEEVRSGYPIASRSDDRQLKIAAWVHDYVLRPRLYWTLLDSFAHFDASYRHRPIAEEIQAEIVDTARRPSTYQIGRGLGSLPCVEDVAKQRRRCTAEYARALQNIQHVDVPPIDTSLPLFYFPVLVRNKSALLHAARRHRVEIIPWPGRTPIYPIDDAARLPAYGYEPRSCPVAESVAACLVGLPTHRRITATHLRRVVDLLRRHTA